MLQSLPLHFRALSWAPPAPFLYPSSRAARGERRGSLQGDCPHPIPALAVTQGMAQREQQFLGALCLACQDRAALCNDEPGLSPAEPGLRHQPELLIGWERRRQGGSPRRRMRRNQTAAAAARLGPTGLWASWKVPTQTASPRALWSWQGSGRSFPSSLPAASALTQGKRARSQNKQEPVYSAP